MYLLDTNIFIGILRKKKEIITKYGKKFSKEESKRYITSYSIIELYNGILDNPNIAKRNEEQKIINIWLDNITKKKLILYFTENEVVIYSHLQKELKIKGNPIPIFDLLIGSISISNKMKLITTDHEHFSKIQEINRNFQVEYW